MGGSLLISDGYATQLRDMHANDLWGKGELRWYRAAIKYATKLQAKTVLDYGAGSGRLKKLMTDREVFEYDPAVPGKDIPPQPADMVACLDVLEHIEPVYLSNVLEHLHSLTLLACMVAISTRPAEKRLPDGRNAHLIIDNGAWWVEQLRKWQWSDISVKVCDGAELLLWMRR